MTTRVIEVPCGFMAMKFTGFPLFKSWKPISWTIHTHREQAEREASNFARIWSKRSSFLAY